MMKTRVAAALAALFICVGSAGAADKKPVPEPAVPSAAAPRPQKIDINRATVEELVAVPGIGQKMAVAIVDLRSKKGSFSRVEDLLEVPGIKEKKLANLA